MRAKQRLTLPIIFRRDVVGSGEAEAHNNGAEHHSMSATVGRAGFDVEHMQHGESGTSDRRARTLGESMRELGSAESLAYYVKHNPNIVESLTAENLAYVNDGSGAFRRAASVAEVIAYGDAREQKVFRKVAPKSFTTSTFVMHLPKSMCEAVQYTRSDGKFRTRWVAKDRAEMLRYFGVAVEQLSTTVLRGGHDAVHGYDLNLDETTPHIQILADTFEDDPKHEGRLRVAASKMWGSHPDVRNSEGHQETRFQKMRRYQKEFRERMVSEGFDVAPDVDPVRHDRKESKPDYVELQEGKEDLAVEKRKFGMDQADLKYGKSAVKSLRAEVDAERLQVDAERAELPELRRKAQAAGRAEGLAEGRAEADAALASKRAELLQKTHAARREIAAAQAAQRAAQAREDAAAAVQAEAQSVIDGYRKGLRLMRDVDAANRALFADLTAIKARATPELKTHQAEREETVRALNKWSTDEKPPAELKTRIVRTAEHIQQIAAMEENSAADDRSLG